MDFLIYSRANPSAATVEHAPALDEEHWSYMDGFADRMTARGPTLTADRERWTGSLHIVDLPGAAAARAFAEREPYNRAGLFEHHLVRRFENLLGRTMWEFPETSADPRFLLLAHVAADAGDGAALPLPGSRALPRERLIVHGELLTPDDAKPAGVALAFQAPTRATAEALLRDVRPQLDERVRIEILDWEFGGRR
jgi:uncharacterized protein